MTARWEAGNELLRWPERRGDLMWHVLNWSELSGGMQWDGVIWSAMCYDLM